MKNIYFQIVFFTFCLLFSSGIQATMQENADQSYDECEKIRKAHPNYHIVCTQKKSDNIPDLQAPRLEDAFGDSSAHLKNLTDNAKLLDQSSITKTNLGNPSAEEREMMEGEILKDQKKKAKSRIIDQNDIDSAIGSIEAITPDGLSSSTLNLKNGVGAQDFIDKSIRPNNEDFQEGSINDFRFKESSNLRGKDSKGKSLIPGMSNDGNSNYLALANLELHKLFSDSLSSFKSQLSTNFTTLSERIELAYNEGEARNKETLQKISESQNQTNSELEILRNNTKIIQENTLESQAILKIIEQVGKNQKEMTSKMNELSHEFKTFKNKIKVVLKKAHIKTDEFSEEDDESEANEDNENDSDKPDEDSERPKKKDSENYKNKIMSLLKKLSKN